MAVDDPAFDERRHSYCPNCYSVRAQVTSVRWGVASRTFAYRCPECGLEFFAELPRVASGQQAGDTDRVDDRCSDPEEAEGPSKRLAR